MKVVSDRKAQEVNDKLQRERELSKVKIKKEDVDLIVSILPCIDISLLFGTVEVKSRYAVNSYV